MTDDTVFYVANARLPSRKAHVYQIVQMCHGLTSTGAEVELVVPKRRMPEGAPNQSPEEYFDVPFDFSYTTLPCIDFITATGDLPLLCQRLAFYLQALTFALTAYWYVHRKRSRSDRILTRSVSFAVLTSIRFGRDVVLEIHHVPSKRVVQRAIGAAMNRLRGVVVITEGLADKWRTVTDAPMLVAPDGVELDRFRTTPDKTVARSELGLPDPATIAMYVGSLKTWKGVQTLLRAADSLSDDVLVCVVGGTESQREELLDRVGSVPENVRFEGHVKPDLIPKYLAAGDIFVLPNSAHSEKSQKYTSPLKLFEYMASKRPIVASDLPSIREILSDDSAYFFEPDDPDALATAIREVIADKEGSAGKVERAHETVQSHTWRARAMEIIEMFITRGRR